MALAAVLCARAALAAEPSSAPPAPPVSAPPQSGLLSSLKQAFKQDIEHEVVRGHFDEGSPPQVHRLYCLVDEKTGQLQPNAVAGNPYQRPDGMTGIKGAAVSFSSCVSAEQQGLLVTSDYALKVAVRSETAPTPRVGAARAARAPPPETESPGSSRPEIELVELTNAWALAIKTKDLPSLESLLAPEFALHSWDDTVPIPRAEWLKQFVEGYEIAQYQHSAVAAQVYGTTGIVTSKWHRRGAQGSQPVEEHGYAVDVWRRKSDHWQVVSRTTLALPGAE